MNDLEILLRERANNYEEKKIVKLIEEKELPPLRANKGASLFDFIKMISKIVDLTMKDLNVLFIPDEGKGTYLGTDQPIDRPMITYNIIDRSAKGELKPRIRESIQDIDKDGNVCIGNIYGQKFKCHLQFNIFASVYTTAEQVMERFETAMLMYAGYFKKNGVGELLFDKQVTDEDFEIARQSLSIRNIRYYVEIEKLTVIMSQSIVDIDAY